MLRFVYMYLFHILIKYISVNNCYNNLVFEAEPVISLLYNSSGPNVVRFYFRSSNRQRCNRVSKLCQKDWVNWGCVRQ